VIGRGHGMTGRVRSVAAVVRHGSLGFCTGASDHLQDRRSGQAPRGIVEHEGLIGCDDASDQSRSDASGHEWGLTRNERTLALWRSVHQVCVSGRGFTRMGYA
jgi:hypothetical protein